MTDAPLPPPVEPPPQASLPWRCWRVIAGLLLPLLAAVALQLLHEGEPAALGVQQLARAQVLVSDAATPPPGLAGAPLRPLPLRAIFSAMRVTARLRPMECTSSSLSRLA